MISKCAVSSSPQLDIPNPPSLLKLVKRSAMKFVFALAVLALAVATAEGIECQNYCDNVSCSGAVSECACAQSNGVYTQNGTLCGCCPACLKKVLKGDVCYYEFEFGAPPSRACESGSTCQSNGTAYVCV